LYGHAPAPSEAAMDEMLQIALPADISGNTRSVRYRVPM
jgi:hypothetical protein